MERITGGGDDDNSHRQYQEYLSVQEGKYGVRDYLQQEEAVMTTNQQGKCFAESDGKSITKKRRIEIWHQNHVKKRQQQHHVQWRQKICEWIYAGE
jgi:hypothetical protein